MRSLLHKCVCLLCSAICFVLNSPERPVEFLLWAPVRGDVDGEQELSEVDVAVLVRVEGAEDVLAELRGVARGEELGVDLDERWLAQLSRGAVGYEAVVPFLEKRIKFSFNLRPSLFLRLPQQIVTNEKYFVRFLPL